MEGGRMSRVLLVTDAYPPEIRSSSTLMRELAEGLRDRGHAVTVLTTYPSYNLTREARLEFASRTANVVRDEAGVRVLRVPTPPLHNVGRVVKGLSQLSLPLLLTAGGALLPRIDAIIVYSPPLPLGLVAAALKARFSARFVLNVQDLFPQNAIDLGVVKNPVVIAAFEWMEGACYRAADVVTCHSRGNIAWLHAHAALRNRTTDVQLVHNWVDVDAYATAPSDPDVRRELGLGERYVLFFGGVMGYAQDLQTVVRAAALLEHRDDIAFLLVGDGVEREALRKLASGLSNVVFHPFVEPGRYVRWLRAMDAGIVTLRADMKTPVVPSKILGFMAAGRPYVALLPRESDAWGITAEARCGRIVPPGDPQAAARAIEQLASDRARSRAMGRRGETYCRQHFSRDACIDKYDSILHSLEGR
jgi:glycosyltransferase involved in cell wall biosynthesis